MLERDIEEDNCVYARKRYGAMALKFTSPQRNNVPDRIFLFPHNIHFFIEYKATGKKASDGQKREHKRLRDRGHQVYVVDDVDQGRKIIDTYGMLL